jgi:hypothetical protein
MPMLGESPGPTTAPTTVDLNAIGDTFIPVPFAQYIVRRMTVYGTSRTLAASAATIGAYTASAAGGSLISTPATKVGLTAATKFLDCTIAAPATTDYLTPTAYTPVAGGLTQYGLFVRVGVADGVATTCKVVFELEGLL